MGGIGEGVTSWIEMYQNMNTELTNRPHLIASISVLRKSQEFPENAASICIPLLQNELLKDEKRDQTFGIIFSNEGAYKSL